ncbi:hypothetical protein L596_012712 [Steinernema carpocapsae]|uniref:Uncharacterized protein n=1 Tax=Steinernema carpocapsae TaxID=34508 RepID=A0A4U5NXY3_STECR|nr:hypothetical protein L596_012712 [Steinernema carpocapsae]
MLRQRRGICTDYYGLNAAVGVIQLASLLGRSTFDVEDHVVDGFVHRVVEFFVEFVAHVVYSKPEIRNFSCRPKLNGRCLNKSETANFRPI